MKKLLIILILALGLQSLIKAEDMSNFEIDGMSLGDSMLDHLSEKEINESKDESHEDRQFITKTFSAKTTSSYEVHQITYKRLDKKKELHAIVGVIGFPDNINKCKKKMKIISSELSILFPSTPKKDWGKYDMPKGHYFPITFTFKDKSRAMVACFNWNEKSDIKDNLKVSLYSAEYREYLASKNKN